MTLILYDRKDAKSSERSLFQFGKGSKENASADQSAIET
jgi:hypothetical protein